MPVALLDRDELVEVADHAVDVGAEVDVRVEDLGVLGQLGADDRMEALDERLCRPTSYPPVERAVHLPAAGPPTDRRSSTATAQASGDGAVGSCASSGGAAPSTFARRYAR